MYSSGYSQVSKYGTGAVKKTQYRSKGKSCGYYMRIVFFFSSLIQSLIIVSLVLFLVYGKKQDSASSERIRDLEESFSRLSIENVALRHQRKNLTNLLNITLTIKARNDWDLEKFRQYSNMSAMIIREYDRKLQQCKSQYSTTSRFTDCTRIPDCNCGSLGEQLKARLALVESNFTQTTQRMKIEMEQTAKERDYINLEAIHLRREKSVREKEFEFHKQKCKDDFFQSLSGVSNVSKAFLLKIESLFPSHAVFLLSCSKQRDYMEQIHSNCTSLSREVEDKFQSYLNSVGDQLTDIREESSRLKAENWRLSNDYRACTQNRTGMIQDFKQRLDRLQQKHDQDKEKLLVDKMRLNGEIEVLVNNVKFKIKEVDHLTLQIRHLNQSCMSRTGLGGLPSGSNTRTSILSQAGWVSSSVSGGHLDRSGLGGSSSSPGSTGSLFNRPASTGIGSSSSSSGSSSNLGSTGSLFNKPASTGIGSSSSSGRSSSYGSTGSLFNKPASTGTGSSSSSSGSLFNKPGSTGTGSSSSSSGSLFNKPASTGTGSSSSSSGSLFNKPASTGTGSSSSSSGSLFNKPASTGTGSSSSSSGSLFNKPASTGTGSSSSSSGSLFNKPASTGTGSSSSSFGSLFNKPASTGTGSSSSSSGSSSSFGSTGSLFNKPASTGTGSSSSSSGSSSSFGSTGSLFNKPASTGTGSSSSSSGSSSSLGSTGSGLNRFGSAGKTSSSSSLLSSGSSSSLGSTGLNKPTSNGKSSSVSSSGSTSSSSGSTSSSSGSNAFSWFGFGNNNAGQSKPGSTTGKGPTSGNSNGGTGSLFSSSRSSSFDSVNVAQHLQDLQRLINPSGQEEKQDLSRMLG